MNNGRGVNAPLEETARILAFTLTVRQNTNEIQNALKASSYVLGFPNQDNSTNDFAATTKNSELAKKLGAEDHICIYPHFFREGFSHQVGLFVHELSHYYDNTADDYDWAQPTRNMSASANLAQLYEQMGTVGTTSIAVQSQYWIWVNAAER